MKVKTVGVVAVKDGMILLVREEKGSGHLTGAYGLPAGHIEEGEASQQTAKRELFEETGLTADLQDFHEFKNNYFEASIPRKDGSIADFAHTVFKVENFDGELTSSSATTPGWYSMEELEALDRDGKLLPNCIAAVKNSQ